MWVKSYIQHNNTPWGLWQWNILEIVEFAFNKDEYIYIYPIYILIDDTYSLWVFVVQLGSCDLFESTWIPLGEKDKLSPTY